MSTPKSSGAVSSFKREKNTFLGRKVLTNMLLRLWSIGIGRDHNRDGQPDVHEVQDKYAAPCAANRELKRAFDLGGEEKWRKRRRHALLIVLAAIRRDHWAYTVGLRPRVCKALLKRVNVGRAQGCGLDPAFLDW